VTGSRRTREDRRTGRSAEEEHTFDDRGYDDRDYAGHEEGPDDDERAFEDGLSVTEAAEIGRRRITEMTEHVVEAVTSVRPSDAGWLVEVEVLEARHVPASSDMLALYRTEIDMAGVLMSYKRVRRYARGRSDINEAS
jgi:hypothetical protein